MSAKWNLIIDVSRCDNCRNCFLATKISFINEMANICEAIGADVKEVARGMGSDKRIGQAFLGAGVGWGGSCFPKDVKALIKTLKQHGCNADLFEAVDRINEAQRTVVIDKLKSVINIGGATIAIWGLSFKPKTDDIREAPALTVIKKLQNLGATVHVFDPVAMDNARNVLRHAVFFEDPYETIKDCNALVVVTEWDEFRNLDMRAVKSLLKEPVVIDGRNIYNPQEMKKIGITYLGIGRS